MFLIITCRVLTIIGQLNINSNNNVKSRHIFSNNPGDHERTETCENTAGENRQQCYDITLL